MTVTFFSNFLNHHQTAFCNRMYDIYGPDFRFVSTEPIPKSFLNNGYPDYTNLRYNINSFINEDQYNKALSLGENSDIVIIGSAPEIFIKARLKQNKPTFRYSERVLRKTILQLLNPRGLIYMYIRHTRYRNKNLFLLCAGSFVSDDMNKIFAYPSKKFKWGYFTEIPELELNKILSDKPVDKIELLWVARFIPLKHPELGLKLARKLKEKGYQFHLNMIGNGPLHKKMLKYILKHNLQDYVDLIGAVPNPEVHHYMRKASIFLFTSDRKEGWGAVVNEAMSNGCAVVASDSVGCSSFLISSNRSGFIYKSCNLKDLFDKVKNLIDNKELREIMSMNAYHSMKNTWSPDIAVMHFIKISESIMDGKIIFMNEGPCSKC